MKRLLAGFLALALIVSGISVCGMEVWAADKQASRTVDVKKVSLNKKKITLILGSDIKLKAKVTTAKAKNIKIIWNSSNSKVASVKNGKVTGISIGSTVITAKAGGKKAYCEVKVVLNKKARKAVQAYQKFLSQEEIEPYLKPEETRFSLIYINDDNVPELALMDRTGYVRGIYCYYNGEVKSIGYSQCAFMWYYPRKGIITVYYAHNIYSAETYIKISKSGKVQELGSKENTDDGMQYNEFFWKGKSVSKSGFERLLKKEAGSKKVKFKIGYANTEQNRRRMEKLIKNQDF